MAKHPNIVFSTVRKQSVHFGQSPVPKPERPKMVRGHLRFDTRRNDSKVRLACRSIPKTVLQKAERLDKRSAQPLSGVGQLVSEKEEDQDCVTRRMRRGTLRCYGRVSQHQFGH